MNASDLLAELRAAGFTLRPLPGGAVGVSPAERLTDEIRTRIRAHKRAILAQLAAEAGWPACTDCAAPAPYTHYSQPICLDCAFVRTAAIRWHENDRHSGRCQDYAAAGAGLACLGCGQLI